jgi:uncharacterized membrane protein YbhN (UPF0104 family)
MPTSPPDTRGRAAERADTGIDGRAIAKRIAFFVVVLVVVVVGVSTLPGVGEVRDRLRDASPWWLVVAAVLRLGSMLGFVRALWAVFDRLMRWRRALVLGLAEQGANVLLPAGGAGGPALGAYVMTRLGVPSELAASRHAALFLSTSVVGFAAIVFAGVGVATGVLAGDVSRAAALLPAAGGAALLTVIYLYARRPPAAESRRGGLWHRLWQLRHFVHDGVRTTVELLRHGDRLLIFGAVTYYAFDVASLGAAFQAFGGGAPPVGVFVLAYTLGHAGALLPTPGGVGGTEGGLIGMFVLYGTPLSVATAAVLAYRVFQLGLPAVFGAIGLVRVHHVLAHPPPRAEVEARFAQQLET